MILQIYNNDWLEIVVYTERTGTIEIEFVAKKIFFCKFFFKFFYVKGIFFLRSDGKIEKKIKERKNCFFFFVGKI